MLTKLVYKLALHYTPYLKPRSLITFPTIHSFDEFYINYNAMNERFSICLQFANAIESQSFIYKASNRLEAVK